MRTELQPAYLLHGRKISDSRILADFITQDFGQVSGVVRAPGKKKPPLLSFVPMNVSWVGKNELKTITQYEQSAGQHPHLEGRALYCAFYINEITQRLLSKGEALPQLFQLYQITLFKLSLPGDMEPTLRRFELALLKASGSMVQFDRDAKSGQAIREHCYYQLHPGLGFCEVSNNSRALIDGVLDKNTPRSTFFLGQYLLAIAQDDLGDKYVQYAAKWIVRIMFKSLFGNRPLKSRELFKAILKQN